MKDYSSYHPNFKDKVLNDGQILFGLQKDSSEGYDVTIDGVATKIIVVDKYNNPDGDLKRITGDIGSFDIGSVVVHQNKNWIVIQDTINNPINKSGIIKMCNNTLKFYATANENSNLWELKEVPCIVGKSTINLDTNKFISLPADEYFITCPNNVDSSKISMDTRFILSGSAYKILGIDNISTLGLLNIGIKEDVVSEDDNLVDSIANYYSHQNAYSIQLNSSQTVNLNYLNQTAIIDVTCFANGVEDASPILSVSNDNPYVCNTDINNHTITCIGTGVANLTINYQGATTTIIVNGILDMSDNYAVSISGSDIIKIGQQGTYVGLITNNGVASMRNVIWELFANDEISSTNLASIVSTSGTYGENVLIKANSNMLYGTVKLKCKTDNNLYSTIKPIMIKSLL